MTILLNGGSNPYNVKYNNTYLSEVKFNGTTVWEIAPPTLSNFTVSPANNGGTISFSNITRDNMEPYYGLVHGVRADYSANCSVNVSWNSQKVLSDPETSSDYSAAFFFGAYYTVSGLPSKFALGSAYIGTASVPVVIWDSRTSHTIVRQANARLSFYLARMGNLLYNRGVIVDWEDFSAFKANNLSGLSSWYIFTSNYGVSYQSSADITIVNGTGWS